MPGNLKKHLLFLLSAAVFTVAPAGCAATEPERGGCEKEYPAPGGTSYQTGRPDVTLSRWMQFLELSDQGTGRAGEEVPLQSRMIAAYLRLGVLLTGADRITGYEASSRPAGAKAGTWFRNTRLWKSQEAIPLFGLFEENGALTPPDFGDLPERTIFAVRFQWNPVLFLRLLKLAPVNGKAVGDLLRGLTGTEPEAFGKSVAGIWEVAVVSLEEGTAVRVALPDAEGKVYEVLKRLLVNDDAAATVERDEKRTFFYSDQKSRQVFAAPEKRLKELPVYQGALAALPDARGAILCWCNCAPSYLTGTFPPVPDGQPRKLGFQNLTLFRRVPEGMIAWTASTQDLNGECFSLLAPVIHGIFCESSRGTEEPAPEVPESEEKAPEQTVPAVEKEVPGESSEASLEATRQLSAVFGALKGAAEGGAFPGGKRAAELLGEDLLRRFCYIEGWQVQDNGKLPLLIQRPGEETGDRFLVLCVDGSCRLIPLEDYRSLKRAAGELHSRYGYREQDFIRLIGKAVQEDRRSGSAPPGLGK